MNNSIEQTKTMHLEDAYVLVLNTSFDDEPSTPEEDDKDRREFKELCESLLAVPKENYENMPDNQFGIMLLIKTADIYARAKWEEACIATRKSMTEESGLMPSFNP